MTTNITVKAGTTLPVEVKLFNTTDGSETSQIVLGGSSNEYVVHSTQELHVRELPPAGDVHPDAPDAVVAEAATA